MNKAALPDVDLGEADPVDADRATRWPFLAGGGEMGARMRSFDWDDHPLGSPDGWPSSLRTMVSTCLRSPLLTTVLWGPRLVMLYNDAYIPSMADRHPGALGTPVDEVWGDAWAQVSQPFLDAMQSGIGFSQDGVVLDIVRHGTHETTYWDIVGTPFIGEDGRIAGIFNQGIEITERVLAERRVVHEIRRQRLIYERMPGFVGVLRGPEHVFEYVNDAYVKIAGGRDLVGRGVREVFPELHDQGFYELLDQVFASGERFVANAVPIRLDGDPEERFLDLLYEPLRDDAGVVTGIFVGGYDATDNARARAALAASEAALRELNENLEMEVQERTAERDRIWQNSHDLITVIDLEGTLLSVNPAFKTALGWTREEMIGHSVMDFIHPEDRPPLREGKLIAERYAKPRIFQNRFRAKDGSYRSISWLSGVEDGLIYSQGRDVTVETQQAEALAQAEESLRQSQKMEAVGQLTGGLAHDFNNLLAGISGSLELVQRRLADKKLVEAERFVTVAQAAAKRAAALTHRLLAFSRRQTLEPKPVKVNKLIADLEEMIRRSIGPGIRLEVVGAVGLWGVVADASQLENALLNLCINARDAMPDGGTITIETANHSIDERTANNRGFAPGQYVSVCVSDTGTGMTPEVASRAFDPFFTTKPIGMGTGLGLSMVYGFAKQSGGHARIYSEAGRGAMVCVYLPRQDAPEESVVSINAAIAPARVDRGETILVVDDEPTVRLLIVEVLGELGYATLEAGDGAEALKILQSQTRIDLLVTDVGLPGGLNGRQVADAARVQRPAIKVLFVTGYAESAVLGHGHLDAGMHVMTKPFELAAFGRRVKDLIDG